MYRKFLIAAAFVLAVTISSVSAQTTHTYNNKEKSEFDGSFEVVSREGIQTKTLLKGGIVGGTYFLKNSSFGFRCEASWSRLKGVGSLITTLCGGEAKVRKGPIRPFAVVLAGMTNESPYSRSGPFLRRPDLGVGVDLGGGVDIPITKNIQFRARVDRLISRLAIGGDIPSRNNDRASVGVVLSFK